MTQDQIDMLAAIYMDLHNVDPTKLRPAWMLEIAKARPIDFHHSRALLSAQRKAARHVPNNGGGDAPNSYRDWLFGPNGPHARN